MVIAYHCTLRGQYISRLKTTKKHYFYTIFSKHFYRADLHHYKNFSTFRQTEIPLSIKMCEHFNENSKNLSASTQFRSLLVCFFREILKIVRIHLRFKQWKLQQTMSILKKSKRKKIMRFIVYETLSSSSLNLWNL